MVAPSGDHPPRQGSAATDRAAAHGITLGLSHETETECLEAQSPLRPVAHAAALMQRTHDHTPACAEGLLRPQNATVRGAARHQRKRRAAPANQGAKARSPRPQVCGHLRRATVRAAVRIGDSGRRLALAAQVVVVGTVLIEETPTQLARERGDARAHVRMTGNAEPVLDGHPCRRA
jgi:hypothetical protein